MKNMYRGGLVYEAGAPMDRWLKLMLSAIVAVTLIIGLVMVPFDEIGAFFMLGTTVFLAALFAVIMPRKYRIYEDRIKIQLGGPFSVDVPFGTIKEIRPLAGASTQSYNGVKFATSMQNVVEITRRKGMGMTISPADRDLFLQQADWALTNWRKMN
jgi:hypothetical protein